MTTELNSWQEIQAEVLTRIQSRQWKPGDLIPNESELAEEFGCARATVNRALRAVAEAGLLDRRRRAGTRVAVHPVRRATLHIPIIRQEIEDQNCAYGYILISQDLAEPPIEIRGKLGLNAGDTSLHAVALHLADSRPYVYEDRWINILSVPSITEVDLKQQNANEWLVANAPFTHGDIAFTSRRATGVDADILGTEVGDALFVMERRTWAEDVSITSVKQIFHPGYRMHTTL